MQKHKIRKKKELQKQFLIRKAIVLNGRNFGNTFSEQFDIIVYCIVDAVYIVLAGISLVISETAC